MDFDHKIICPICSTIMIPTTTISGFGNQKKIVACENKCYKHIQDVKNVNEKFFIFDDVILLIDFSSKRELYEKVENEINYWKENERYLMKIMNNEE